MDKSPYTPVDSEPETPILPEDAPEGVPDKILTIVPYLYDIIVIAEKIEGEDDVSGDSDVY